MRFQLAKSRLVDIAPRRVDVGDLGKSASSACRWPFRSQDGAASLERFSRDQEDTAGLFKRLTFAGVNIVTLAEGDITHLHIGLKGTMNALFLKELAEKTRRGLRGRIELGKAGGGVSFGYRIVRRLENGVVSTRNRSGWV